MSPVLYVGEVEVVLAETHFRLSVHAESYPALAGPHGFRTPGTVRKLKEV